MAGWGLAVKAMRVMSRLSGDWQGSRGELIYVKACQDKAVKARFVRAR